MSDQQRTIARKPGEIGFALLFVLFGALGYYFALDMTSGKYSSPSVLPKVASSVIMAMGFIELLKSLKRRKNKYSATELMSFLFTKEVFFVLILLGLYSVFLPVLHFPLASFLFLLLSLLYLHSWGQVKLCTAVSVGTVIVLVGVFKYIFQVILP